MAKINIFPLTTAIMSMYGRHPQLEPHKERATNGTQYIMSFQTRGGSALAVDKTSGEIPAIFALKRQFPDDVLAHIEREDYPPQEGPNPGHNSNVNVYQLKGKHLVRLRPKSLPEAMEIVAHLTAA